jgi:hypothetical protein
MSSTPIFPETLPSRMATKGFTGYRLRLQIFYFFLQKVPTEGRNFVIPTVEACAQCRSKASFTYTSASRARSVRILLSSSDDSGDSRAGHPRLSSLNKILCLAPISQGQRTSCRAAAEDVLQPGKTGKLIRFPFGLPNEREYDLPLVNHN